MFKPAKTDAEDSKYVIFLLIDHKQVSGIYSVKMIYWYHVVRTYQLL